MTHSVTPASSWFSQSPGKVEPVARLLCFAHAGGSASSFNHWRRLVPDWIDLVKVQLPGRDGRIKSPPCVRMEDVIVGLSPHLESLLDRPLAIYGHSLGAVIAFELTRELRRRVDTLPIALFVSGRRAPHKPPRRRVHDLPEEALVVLLQQMGGTLSSVLANKRWRAHYLPMIRADLQLSDSYAYREERPLDCPIFAYLGEEDAIIDHDDWGAWSEQAAGEFSRGFLPGTHFFTSNGQATLIAKIVDTIKSKISSSVDTLHTAFALEENNDLCVSLAAQQLEV